MNNVWQFATAGVLHFGRGSISQVCSELKRRAVYRPLIVTDGNILNIPVVQDLLNEITESGEALTIFDQCAPEPAISVAEQAILAGQQAAADGVVGIGGGSNLDVAKIVATVLRHGGEPRDYFGFDRVPGAVLPVFALPTTAGTGSEVSHSAVLTDEQSALKVSTLSNWLRPACAIVDPQLTDSCPKSVTAASGIDALVHAIEALSNRSYRQMVDVDPQAKAYQGSYALTTMMACEAIRLVGKSLVKACQHPDDVESRDNMAMAAMLAGMAFSNSGVGIVHALEYPIGALTHCGHGEGNGLLLPHVMRYNLDCCQLAYAQVAACLSDQAMPVSDMTGHDLASAARAAVDLVCELQTSIGIRTTLHQLGLARDDIPQVAEKAFNIRRLMDLNAKPPTLSDLVQILESAYQ